MIKLINPIDGFQSLNLNDKARAAVEFTDQTTNARNLLINRDFVDKDKIIERLSIYELKQSLSICLCAERDNSINKLLNFDYADIPEIIKAIRFYERQVIRQLCETEDITEKTNIFNVNHNLKFKLVELNIFAIIDYFSKQEGRFIWGTMDEKQKSTLIRIVMFDKSDPDTKNTFIETIANYTCLKDYPNYHIKRKALDRFLIK